VPDQTTAPPTDAAPAATQTAEQDPAERMVAGTAPMDEGQRAQMAVARANQELVQRGDWSLPARHAIDAAQLEVLRATVAKDLNAAEMAMFLEVSARYKLDPFLKHVFAAKFDGSSGGVTIFTGRDGLLHAARGTGKFVRMISAVVRKKDEFSVETRLGGDGLEELPEGDPSEGAVFGGVTRLTHKRTGMGDDRGEIIGAYALVWKAGDPEPYYAEAPWSEHGQWRQKDGSNRDTAWTLGSRKGFPEQMMRKVPESIALRMAFGITGIVGAEELGDTPERVQNLSDAGGAAGVTATPLVVEYGDDELGAELMALVEVANELVHGSWRAAKVAMRINGKPQARAKLRDTLRRFIGQRHGGRERLDAIPRADVTSEGEPVKDAEVVEDKPQEPAQAPQEPEATTDQGEAPAAPEEPQDGAEEVVDGEVVPEPELPEYDQPTHSALVDECEELRGIIEGMGEEPSPERAEAERELAVAEENLRLMNLAAAAAGQPQVG
jgi:hypothetical protein